MAARRNIKSGDEDLAVDGAEATPAPTVPAAPPIEATPSMAQFLEIKAANPDSLLWYRMGDFYEMFFEDAVIASGRTRHRAHQAGTASRRRHPDVRCADPPRR